MNLDRLRPARLAAYGAFAACGGIALLFLLFVVFTAGGESGLDGISAALSWISLGGIAIALIAVHIFFGRQLMRMDGEMQPGRRA